MVKYRGRRIIIIDINYDIIYARVHKNTLLIFKSSNISDEILSKVIHKALKSLFK
ncbi:MAG: hypothetical protein ACRC7N_03655 [Clostridium sp.]